VIGLVKILVLGGAGFIGRRTVERLHQAGHVVTVFEYPGTEDVDGKYKTVFGDILDKRSMAGAFSDQEVVLNFIGQITEDPQTFYDINVIGALNIIDLCKKNGVDRIIQPSSYLVYGNQKETPNSEDDPTDPRDTYTLTKLITEKIYMHMAEEHGIDLAILRFANVYGPGGRGVINKFMGLVQEDREIVINDNGEQVRDFIYVDDVSEMVARMVDKQPKGVEVFNVSTSKGTNLNRIVELLEKALSKEAIKRYREPIDDGRDVIIGDNRKIFELLEFSPDIDVEKGIGYLTER
jgi:UDP-glucose 4-epimerase